MPQIAIYFLEFDEENIEHVGRHGVSPREIEQITGNPYITARNARGPKNRIFMIGRTDGDRMLTVVLEATEDDAVWRPVTAWDAAPEERRLLGTN